MLRLANSQNRRSANGADHAIHSIHVHGSIRRVMSSCHGYAFPSTELNLCCGQELAVLAPLSFGAFLRGEGPAKIIPCRVLSLSAMPLLRNQHELQIKRGKRTTRKSIRRSSRKSKNDNHGRDNVANSNVCSRSWNGLQDHCFEAEFSVAYIHRPCTGAFVNAQFACVWGGFYAFAKDTRRVVLTMSSAV